MKNVFAYNTKMNELDGKSLKLREIDEDMSQRQDKLVDEGKHQEKKASLPLWMQIVKTIGQFLILVTFGGSISGILNALSNGKTFAEIAKNGWWIWMIGGIGAIVYMTLYIMEKKKAKTVVESEETEIFVKHSEALYWEIMETLKVPKDAPPVDVLGYPYKLTKKGNKKNAGIYSVYVNLQAYIYREEENLCFADVGSVYAIPVEGLRRIVKIKKAATFPNWNKEEPYNKGEYKKYKVHTSNLGFYVKPYYSLQFIANDEEFEILFPSYELETIKNLTGLSVEEN